MLRMRSIVICVIVLQLRYTVLSTCISPGGTSFKMHHNSSSSDFQLLFEYFFNYPRLSLKVHRTGLIQRLDRDYNKSGWLFEHKKIVFRLPLDVQTNYDTLFDYKVDLC